MHKDEQKKSLQRSVNQQVEYRDRSTHAKSRERSIQAKKVKAKAKHRKRNIILFYFVLFTVIITAAITLSLTVLFKINTIQVIGTSRYSAEDIIKESGILQGDNLFLIQKVSAENSLKEKMPYIGTVTISRKLPGTVQIEISDATVAGIITHQSNYYVIDSIGKVLEQVTTIPENFPQIIGLNFADARVGEVITYTDNQQKMAFTSLVDALMESEFDKITRIDLSDTYSIQVEYDGRVTMNFGIAEDLVYKARFAKKLFDSEQIKSDEKGILNLTVVTEKNQVYFSPDYSISSSMVSSEVK